MAPPTSRGAARCAPAPHHESPTVFPQATADGRTAADAVVALAVGWGVRRAFGLLGGPIAPFAAALERSPIDVVHCRHEGGAAFAALEASLCSGAPTLVFTTTGPGLLNALGGLAAVRPEGGRVLVVSAHTAPAQRGRGAAQQTCSQSVPYAGLFTAGPLFDAAAVVEDVALLPPLAAQIGRGLRRPQGFCAHLALPVSQQTRPAAALSVPLPQAPPPAAGAATVAECAAQLAAGHFATWVGFGARHAGAALRELAALSGCAVMCSPRAKGDFAEDHPQYVGVTGLGGHLAVDAYMAAARPQRTLVLGTRLGEGTSYWSTRLVPSGGFVHVDLDPTAFGAAYPEVPCLGVQAEIEGFVRALVAAWPDRGRRPPAALRGLPAAPPLALRATGPVRPQALMQAIQAEVVDPDLAPVLAESGNTFVWANHLLRFRAPGRYRVSPGYGAMGHFTAGVLGLALARGGKAVALVGDGAMLMNSEVNTAVAHRAAAVWVVLNDAQYGMVEQGMRALGYPPVQTQMPRTDFAALAEAMGATGLRVRHEVELAAALRCALGCAGPVVVDVALDAGEASPLLRRIESLKAQSSGAPA